MNLFLRYIPLALLAVLLLLMLRNRAYKVCPWFFAYVAFGVGADVARFVVDSHPHAYYVTYWITEAGYCLLGILVMYELLRLVLRSLARRWWARLILPVALLAVAWAALLLTPHESILFGLNHQQFASAAIGVSLLLWLVMSGLRSARPSDIARLATAAMTWVLLFIALTGVYAYRFEAFAIVGRIAGELFPSEPQVGRGGEVIVNRRLSGEFAIAGRVNAARVTFLFDTGASAVVLTAEDARRAGVETSRLVFDVPVATANGGAKAAEARLDQVAIGPIVMRTCPRWSRAAAHWTKACSA